MNTGQIISGAGHAGLIFWALFGGAFRDVPPPHEVTEVTAISAEDYAALMAPEQSPEAVANVDTPEPPEAGEAPGMTSEADAVPETAQPEVAETSEPDTPPEVTEPDPPAQAEVSDEPPVMQPPQEDTAALVPEVSPDSQPREAPRVAPEPVARPEPDVQIDDVDQQETAPDESAEPVEEDQEETAREEATTEIVTEADDPADAAPSRSLRPRTRPTRQAEAETEAEPEAEPQPEPQEQTETAAQQSPEVDENAVENALAEALGGAETQADSTPSGPPLTAGEKEGLRVAVQQCWNVGSLSSEALNTTVVVSVSMSEDGRPITASIEMLSASGGSDSAARQAFEAARRAIIRCGADGYKLPPEKYDQWRDIEMTFNPEKMRIK
ncbi:energy transducer TonB family protein [Roseovarius indicus]|uniref:energy transducer TonB family protein n=1 Tax=Roseovarius indicus TaxID=540747 RepID=UPI0032EB905D